MKSSDSSLNLHKAEDQVHHKLYNSFTFHIENMLEYHQTQYKNLMHVSARDECFMLGEMNSNAVGNGWFLIHSIFTHVI